MKDKKTILVTGGAGFVGSSLVGELIKDPNNYVVIVDNLQTGSKDKIPDTPHENLKFIHCDVNKEDQITSVFHTFSFDYVFHYAALVGVQRTLDNPTRVLSDITGIENILNLSKNTGVKRVIYSSSSEVYGEPVEYPQNEETTPLNSRLPYAIVKNVGEAFLKSYKQEFGNNINASINAAFSDEFANQTINIGNNIETKIIDLAQTIIRLTNSSSKVIHLPPLVEGDMTRRNPDITKMEKLSTLDMITLEKGLEQVIKNPSFIL